MSTEPAPSPVRADPILRRILGFFILILAVLIFVVVTSLQNLNRSIATSDWVNHTHALITEIDALQPTLLAAEGALSKYLLTADPLDHATYQDKFSELGERVDVITALTAGSAGERQQFEQIAALLAKRAEQASRISLQKKSGDNAALQQLLAEDTAGNDRQELERSIQKFRLAQTDLLTARDRASFVQNQTTRWTVLSGVVLDFLLLCGAAWLIRDDLTARRRAAKLLQQSNDELEARVRERTAELSTTNEQLRAQSLEDRWSKQAIEHQNRYNLLIIDSISDAVIVVTKLMNISRLNPAAVHLGRYEPAELVDQPLSRLVQLDYSDGASVPPFDVLARTLIDGHELRNRPAIVTTKSGKSLPVRLNVYPLRDRDKVVGGVIILQTSAPATP